MYDDHRDSKHFEYIRTQTNRSALSERTECAVSATIEYVPVECELYIYIIAGASR